MTSAPGNTPGVSPRSSKRTGALLTQGPTGDRYAQALHMLSPGPFIPARKLNAGNLTPWRHHRGGWKFICRLIAEHLHCEDGVRFIGSVEDGGGEGRIIAQAWVGLFSHGPE